MLEQDTNNLDLSLFGGGGENVPAEPAPETEVADKTPITEQVPIVNEVETPFFKLETKDEKDLNDFQVLAKSIQDKYQAEIKEPKDILNVLGKIDEYQEKELNYLAQIKEMSMYKQTLANMPDDLKTIVVDWINGSDYHKTINDMLRGSAIDYSKEATAYNQDTLIKMYHEDVTNEELEDMDEKNKARLYQASVKQFNADRERILTRADKAEKENEKRRNDFERSIEESINHLKSKYPQFSKSKIESIEEKMRNGYTMYEDGRYAKDAALKIAMSEYGDTAINVMKQTIEQQHKALLNLKVSEEREFYARHQADRPTPSASVSPKNELTKIVDAETDFLKAKY